jgi:CubicO group peptidase (beta-lactamase class C family)
VLNMKKVLNMKSWSDSSSILLMVFILITCVAAGAGASDNRVAELLEPIRQKHKLPALAGAIVTGRGLEAIGATGIRKAGTPVTVTVEDEWHLGSDTKAMTATIIARLVERGKLSWETTLGQVFPGLARSMNPQMRDVTILELLSHRAGLPHDVPWHQFASSGHSLREQRQDVVKLVGSMQPASPPGSKYEYSNVGYVLAGAIAERITGDDWEDLIHKIVFDPLGMRSAGFGGLGTPGKIDQPWPHYASGQPLPGNGPTVDNPEVMGPAGTVHCSLADWAKFVGDQLRGDRGERALLAPESYKRLHTPAFGGDYALGWLVVERPWGGGTVLNHNGSNTMNYAVAWVAPKRDFAVLVCTNQGGDSAVKGTDEAAAALIQLHQKQ